MERIQERGEKERMDEIWGNGEDKRKKGKRKEHSRKGGSKETVRKSGKRKEKIKVMMESRRQKS